MTPQAEALVRRAVQQRRDGPRDLGRPIDVRTAPHPLGLDDAAVLRRGGDDDGQAGVNLDSFLEVDIDGATTFYIHVVDWGGNARPDMLYDLIVSGVN